MRLPSASNATGKICENVMDIRFRRGIRENHRVAITTQQLLQPEKSTPRIRELT
jgi:hypothetical protein